MGQPRLNLSKVRCLLADRDVFTRGLIAQMLRGFGMGTIQMASNGEQLRELVTKECPDVCLIEAALPDIEASELIAWIRKQPEPLRFVPIIVLSGYTQLRLVTAARDAGANLVIRKPASAQMLFDRLAWVANSRRPFIENDNFLGPDRRFRKGPPAKAKSRRKTDVTGEPA
ncbi:MAG: hypothetical protein BGN85_13165 [Alphaproteobacteria bacterium 64-11]|nr:response regulator [Alphaproteobacteria bacterium]OJU08076.1 MAG: hypothetical protein BGN85_13165 [Alphaproteobacteria bacterium 64-11]